MLFNKENLMGIVDDNPPPGYEIVEEGNWEAEGKYEVKEIIFKFQDKFYSLVQGRSGSGYTDWYYDRDNWSEFEECIEVIPVEIKKIEWRKVNLKRR